MIDARSIQGNFSGIALVLIAMIRQMLSDPYYQVELLSSTPTELSKIFNGNVVIHSCPSNEKHPASELWLNFKLLHLIKSRNIDLYWGAAFLLPWVKIPCKRVVTIYDMTPYTFPKEYPWRFSFMMRNYIKYSVRVADVVHCISRHVKKEVLQYFPKVKDKCRIVKCGIPRDFPWLAKEVPYKEIPTDFILALGAGCPRKNTEVIVKALGLITNKNINLVITSVQHKSVVQEGNILYLPWLRYDMLPTLYKRAKAFIFSSLEEGFGLPLIEAASCSCPTLLSDIDVFRELAGDDAAYFDPHDPHDLADKIERILSDDPIREKSIKNGLYIAKQYTIDNMAKGFKEIVEEVLK